MRDLQWRRRRVVVAVLASALVMALSLVLSGLAASFGDEAERTVGRMGADRWLVADTAAGPFTSLTPVPVALAAQVSAQPGVARADPLILIRQTVGIDPVKDLNVFGVVPGGVGAPEPSKGRALAGPGEVVVDRSSGYDIGDRVTLGGGELEVVGQIGGSTFFGGAPNVFVDVTETQRIMAGGLPLATTIVTRGVPSEVPAGLRVLTDGQAVSDALRLLDNLRGAIDLVRALLWVVAACIIGSVVYLSVLERQRDFAVFKATGASTAALGGGLALQAVILALASAVLATLFATVLARFFPLPVAIPTGAYLLLPVVALAVGLVASVAGLRRAVRVQPALAFGGP